MLTYFAAGVAAGMISLATGNAGAAWLRRRGSAQMANPVTALEERVLTTVIPAIEKAAKDSAALTEQVRQLEARNTAFQDAMVAQLRLAATREEVAEALGEVVLRPELELALQSAAQQILAAATSNAATGNGNGRAISALQEKVAGISQQLGMS